MNQGDECTVLIAAPHLLSTLKDRLTPNDRELVAFSDTDVLRALEVISRRRPRTVALEPLFAATPRGAALMRRIKADPTLARSEIRVLSDDAIPAGSAAIAERRLEALAPVWSPSSSAAVESSPPVALDPAGTRGAPRFRIVDVVADVNGSAATVVELSATGAQVLSPTILKPNQRVRLTLTDDQGAVRCNAVVTWAAFEMPPRIGPQFRAGLSFIDANPEVIDAFRVRHQAP